MAGRQGHLGVVALLLERGANVDAKTNNGTTARGVAAHGLGAADSRTGGASKCQALNSANVSIPMIRLENVFRPRPEN